jgi:hypothetical protein
MNKFESPNQEGTPDATGRVTHTYHAPEGTGSQEQKTVEEYTPEQRGKEQENSRKFGGEEYKPGDEVVFSGDVWRVKDFMPGIIAFDDKSYERFGSVMKETKGNSQMTLVRKLRSGENPDIHMTNKTEVSDGMVFAHLREEEDSVHKATPEVLKNMDDMKREMGEKDRESKLQKLKESILGEKKEDKAPEGKIAA